MLYSHVGIDLTDIGGDLLSPDTEPGRRAVLIKKTVAPLQESFSSIEKVIYLPWTSGPSGIIDTECSIQVSI